MRLLLTHLPLLGAAVLAAALLPAVVTAQTKADCAWMYGIDDKNNIIEYNPELKVAKSVLDTGLKVGTGSQGPSNAFGFDSTRARMFFLYDLSVGNGGNVTESGLYFWNQGSPGVLKIADLSELFLTPGAQNPSNAVFANDNYYFIKWGQSILVTCSITAAPDVAGCTQKTIALPAGFTAGNLNFGDVVIDKAGTTMYGSTVNGFFFKVTGLDSSPALEVIKSSTASPKNPSVQLAFGGLYDALYATEFGNGKWYTVNTASGDLTEIPGFLTPNTAPNFFGARDLGGSSCEPAPNPGNCTTYPPLESTFAVKGWGVKKNTGTLKPGQKLTLSTTLYNSKRVSGVQALDDMRVYTYVPPGLAVRRTKPTHTASVPLHSGRLYWWDLDLSVGKKVKVTVWATVDKPYGQASPLEIGSIVWPEYGNPKVCPITDAVTLNVRPASAKKVRNPKV